MRQIIVVWGTFRLELPGEIFVFLAVKFASSLFHHVNV
jgi:hypothetical protein